MDQTDLLVRYSFMNKSFLHEYHITNWVFGWIFASLINYQQTISMIVNICLSISMDNKLYDFISGDI